MTITEFHVRIDTWDAEILERILEEISPTYYVWGKEIAKKTSKEHTHIHLFKTISIKPESYTRKMKRDVFQKIWKKSSNYSIAIARDPLKSQLYVCKDGNFQFSDTFPKLEKEKILDHLENLAIQKQTPFKDQLKNIFKNKISTNSNGRIYFDSKDIPTEAADICNRIYKDINEDRIMLGLLPPTHTDCIKYMKYISIQLEDILHPYDLQSLDYYLFMPFK
jgi:hypothetical protein